MERHLRAGADHQTVIFIQISDTNVHFKMNMLLFWRAIFALVNEICIFESLINIPHFGFNVMNNVVGCVVDANGIGFIMDDRSPLQHRLFRINNRGKHFVLNINQLQSLLGNLKGFSRNYSHPVADMAHFIVQADLVVGQRLRITLTARSIFNPRQILVSKDCHHARQCPGFAGINFANDGMRVGASEQRAVKHAVQAEIIGENRTSLSQFFRIDLYF